MTLFIMTLSIMTLSIMTLTMTLIIIIVDLPLVVRSKCGYEKNRCADAIVEAISLLTSFILFIASHFHYVFMQIC
jgi:hypothetical protein